MLKGLAQFGNTSNPPNGFIRISPGFCLSQYRTSLLVTPVLGVGDNIIDLTNLGTDNPPNLLLTLPITAKKVLIGLTCWVLSANLAATLNGAAIHAMQDNPGTLFFESLSIPYVYEVAAIAPVGTHISRSTQRIIAPILSGTKSINLSYSPVGGGISLVTLFVDGYYD